jgi:hypothetical protein
MPPRTVAPDREPSAYRDAIRRELVAARHTREMFTFELYCDNVRCAARTTSVFVKDYDATLIAMLHTNASAFRCLVCGDPLRWEGCSRP